jgi:hypothetical protein
MAVSVDPLMRGRRAREPSDGEAALAIMVCHEVFKTLVILEVVGRPASYSSAAELAWKAAVRKAVIQTGLGP